LADRPEAANSLIKALRQVFNWAMQKGVDLATSNPARDVPYLKPKNPDGFHTWTISKVEQFEAQHPIGTKPRLALAFLLFTGVRRSDVVHLGRQMDKAGFLIFTEAKGRENKPKHREIKITTALQEVIDATPSGHLTFLVTEFGKPFTHGGFATGSATGAMRPASITAWRMACGKPARQYWRTVARPSMS
jgi:integrase